MRSAIAQSWEIDMAENNCKDENKFWKKLKEIRINCHRIYIYGTGLYGQNIYKILREKNFPVDGFIISSEPKEQSVFDLPVFSARDILSEDVGIVLGLNRNNTMDVRKYLQANAFNMMNVAEAYELIDNDNLRSGYDEVPTVEITTVMGCKVNCKYCPQSLLIKQYYKDNPNRLSVMEKDLFATLLNKLPRNCNVLFSGMAEPLLNKDCVYMIRKTVETGRTVNLYTTLYGMNTETIKPLLEIPIDFITVHVADKYNYAKIPKTEDYFNTLELVINSKKKNGKPFVDVCNAQAEADDRVKKICDGKVNILTTMLDRAGNLSDDNLFSKVESKGKIKCSICGSRLNHNILLPDGTLLLCCMDYGMKHVIGNLCQESYDEIMHGEEITMIKKQMREECDKDILCRRCSCANPVI